MVAKCANPNCGEKFIYLRDGRVFCCQFRSASGQEIRRRTEAFWLCGRCSGRFTIQAKDDQIEIVSISSLARLDAPMSVRSWHTNHASRGDGEVPDLIVGEAIESLKHAEGIAYEDAVQACPKSVRNWRSIEQKVS